MLFEDILLGAGMWNRPGMDFHFVTIFRLRWAEGAKGAEHGGSKLMRNKLKLTILSRPLRAILLINFSYRLVNAERLWGNY